MKKLVTAGILAILFSCSSQPKTDNNTQAATPVAPDTSKAQPEAASDSINLPVQLEGDNTAENRLSQLYDRHVFSTIQSKLLPKLPEKHQQAIKSNPDLTLLAFATGDLFQNNKNDFAFLLYSKQGKRVGILLYDEQADSYKPLYDSVQVEDELDSLKCNYQTGRLDTNLGEQIAVQAGYYAKDPISFLENKQLKITDITRDEDIVIKDGCLSKKATKADFKNVLCIAADYVYNDWKCLRYDKAKGVFVIFYCQAYAD
jgi:hypothetical protein